MQEAAWWRRLLLLMKMRQVTRHQGIRPGSPGALIGMLVQAPILFGLFAAVRNGLGSRVQFLWIADLARADVGLTVVVTGLTAASAAIMPSTASQPVAIAAMIGIVAVGTLMFLWSTSSAVALYAGAGSLVSVLQSWLLLHRTRLRPGTAYSLLD